MMNEKKLKASEYMSDNARFADLCNLALFHGKKVITASGLTEKDSAEVFSILGLEKEEWHELLEGAIVRASNQAVFVLIAIENHADIQYAMPMRCAVCEGELTLVIPITLYLGADKVDVPASVHEMFADVDERVKPFIPDFKIIFISPESLSAEDLDNLDTDVKDFLWAIKNA